MDDVADTLHVVRTVLVHDIRVADTISSSGIPPTALSVFKLLLGHGAPKYENLCLGPRGWSYESSKLQSFKASTFERNCGDQVDVVVQSQTQVVVCARDNILGVIVVCVD